MVCFRRVSTGRLWMVSRCGVSQWHMWESPHRFLLSVEVGRVPVGLFVFPTLLTSTFGPTMQCAWCHWLSMEKIHVSKLRGLPVGTQDVKAQRAERNVSGYFMEMRSGFSYNFFRIYMHAYRPIAAVCAYSKVVHWSSQLLMSFKCKWFIHRICFGPCERSYVISNETSQRWSRNISSHSARATQEE